MKPELPTTPSVPAQSLDQLLNSAVVLNWDAVTQSSTPGRVRVEYHIGADGALEYLKLWSHAREYWSLVCEYSAHLSWSDGPRFCNGYHSRSLSRLLQSIMMNQRLCSHGGRPNTNGTLEVSPPTAEDVDSAKVRISETFPPIAAARGPRRGTEAL
ncbi:MAG TPA: hypothetical protein VL240_06515 [Candidatus Binatia bacterium]|nr:hypothetical protein [Candidatus Binatia bacterium]